MFFKDQVAINIIAASMAALDQGNEILGFNDPDLLDLLRVHDSSIPEVLSCV